MQAIADTLNLRIQIVESSERFSEITLVEGLNVTPHSRSIFIGHIGEMHYVATVPLSSERISVQMSNENVSSMNSFTSNVNMYKRKYQTNVLQSKPLSPDEGQCSSDFPSIRKKKQKQKGVIT